MMADTGRISESRDPFDPTVARPKRKCPSAEETNSDHSRCRPEFRRTATALQIRRRQLAIRIRDKNRACVFRGQCWAENGSAVVRASIEPPRLAPTLREQVRCPRTVGK